MTKKRKVFHQSEIATYLKCGLLWEFQYVKNQRQPGRSYFTVGSAVDAGVNYFQVQKLKTGQNIGFEEAAAVFLTDWKIKAPDTEWDPEEKGEGEQKDMGLQLLKLYVDQVGPTIQPLTIQETFEIQTDAGYDLGGTIDLTEKDFTVRDLKTSKTKYDEDAVTRSLQAAMYDFAFQALHEVPSSGFVFDVMVKPTARKPAEYQEVRGKVTDDDRQWLFNTVENVHKAITAGVAAPAADGAWWCAPKWCPFWSQCKGKNRG